ECMAHLIDDLLDISRTTRGKLTVQRRLVDAVDIIDAAVEACRTSIEARCQRLVVRVPAGESTLLADPQRLVQIVANLLDNASKFTPAIGELELRLAAHDDEIVISVSDNGIGIAEDEIAGLFERFAQNA